MNLSKRIRDLRYSKGWGPDELAGRAKISRTALYQIERGNTSKPQAGTLRKICRALGVTLESLMESTAAPAFENSTVAMSMEPAFASAPTAATPGPVALSPAPLSTAPYGSTTAAARATAPSWGASPDRAEELMEKFRLLLASPLAEGVARIVEESYRLLPIIPSQQPGDTTWYQPAHESDSSRRGRSRSHENV